MGKSRTRKKKKKKKQQQPPTLTRRRKKGYSPFEIFLAVLGAAILVLVAMLIIGAVIK
jgi:hypothetical protein